ncbi:Response regulator MprA [Usitatibacter rugosus]|uniref:Response regulator MprA n=1 Tax=Usitatibacter rugosus TaxID=2732067 RepID=A0A6M4GTL2_9PROT|nr:response regulator [Usitatibacter rugosus]QJR10679.1 Response regulator MprA [Usitatibacter rugosus]
MDTSAPTLTRILQVDDDEDILMIGKTALEGYGGFEVETALGGTEGLKAVAAFKPQLIVLDWMMPGMNGLAFMQELRRRPGGEEIGVVYMTASVSESRRGELIAAGALDVLTKPFDARGLSAQILAIWKRHHGVAAAG